MQPMEMNTFKPCPQCGSTMALAVKWTLWGGVLGPKLLSHVKCQACNTTYSGKTGKSNKAAIIYYNLITFAIAVLFVWGFTKML